MATSSQNQFLQATNGKIILGFFLACLVLVMVWGLNKIAFQKILTTVEGIAAPNERLRTVANLSHQLAGLDQLQKSEALKKTGNPIYFYKESSKIKLGLDTLRGLYKNDSLQLKRLASIQKLLGIRDKQFVEYLKVREGLINNKSFSAEVDRLNKMVDTRVRGADSSVLTTKTTTSTTTVAPEEDEKGKGFLNRLFGKKKAEVYKIINEEFQIKRDTLSGLTEDSIIRSVNGSLQAIALAQTAKSSKFIKREAVLAEANNNLTQQMLDILKKVESEVVAQINQDSSEATLLVNQQIKRIGYILVAFFVFTGILLYFILTDLSRSNRYRKALELAKDEAEYHGKAKQRFLSNMSHEIRTPLQSILGYSELIKQQEHPKRKDLDAIYQSSVHLLQIVNEVLDYNSIVSGELSLSSEIFDVVKLVNEVVDAMHPLAEKKSIGLRRDFLLDETIYIEGDAFRLKQILFNLIGNAIKFTLNGEVVVSVSCEQIADDLLFNFKVKDTGIGFSEENAAKVFEEFEQLHFPEKNSINQTGSGLGLSIVKSLIETQGGTISVESKEGVGTTFNFVLNYKIAPQHKEVIETLENSRVTPNGKVWVIDDDRLILDLCGLILEHHQIAFKGFSNATEVLAEALDDEVKYVLLDMRLPEISGAALCQMLKSKMKSDVKFYAITAQVLPDEREGVLTAGFDGLIMKPFQAQDLLSIFDREELAEQEIDIEEIDSDAIEKMTFGNKELLAKIINRFKADSLADIKTLKESINNDNWQETRLVIHRLAGRVAQIGARKLGFEFRQMEVELAATEKLTMQQEKKLDGLMMKVNQLITQLNAPF